MNLFHCLVFFALTWFVLTGIYKYSTNSRRFFYFVPVLVVFGVFAAFVLHLLKLDDFFLWYIGLLIIVMAGTYLNRQKEIRLVKGPSGYEKSNWLTTSLTAARKYFVISSVVYIASFVVAYLYLAYYR
jgi:hypothetical protein